MRVEASQLRDDAGAFHLKVLSPDLEQLAHFVKLFALQVIDISRTLSVMQGKATRQTGERQARLHLVVIMVTVISREWAYKHRKR